MVTFLHAHSACYPGRDGSLVVMVTALTFSILGSSKHDVKTLIAAILYISAGSVQRREPSYYY